MMFGLLLIGLAVCYIVLCVLVTWQTGRFYDRHTRAEMDAREAAVKAREDAVERERAEYAEANRRERARLRAREDALEKERAKFRAERIELGAKAHDLQTQIHLWNLENDTTRIQKAV